MFTIVCLLSMLGKWSLAEGTTDPFYIRSIMPKKSSLINGSFRAAQDLKPEIINRVQIDVNM